MVSIEAPIWALFLATFAENKVAGFALMKGAGVVLMIPVAAFFLDPPSQYLAGLVPTYWPSKAFWSLQAGEPYLLYWVIGLVYHALVLWWFLKRFNRAMFAK